MNTILYQVISTKSLSLRNFVILSLAKQMFEIFLNIFLVRYNVSDQDFLSILVSHIRSFLIKKVSFSQNSIMDSYTDRMRTQLTEAVDEIFLHSSFRAACFSAHSPKCEERGI